MAVSQQKALAMAGVCTLLVLTFLASDVNAAAACSLVQVQHCYAAVYKGSPPTPECCGEVRGITNFQCFCDILLGESKTAGQAVIDNALSVPMKCDDQNLRNKECGTFRTR